MDVGEFIQSIGKGPEIDGTGWLPVTQKLQLLNRLWNNAYHLVPFVENIIQIRMKWNKNSNSILI